MKFYFGTPGWGWHMFGFGWKDHWFLGFSMKAEEHAEATHAQAPLPQEQP